MMLSQTKNSLLGVYPEMVEFHLMSPTPGGLDKALEMYKRVKAQRLSTKLKLYPLFIDVAFREGRYDVMFEFFELVKSSGFRRVLPRESTPSPR